MSVKLMAMIWELDLPPVHKLVGLAYADHANDVGLTFPSMSRVAWKSGLSRETVKRCVREFRISGLLEEIKTGTGRGNATLYRLHPEKGRTLTPFAEIKRVNDGAEKGSGDEQRGSPETERGSDSSVKGVIAVTPESSVTVKSTVKIEPSGNRQGAKRAPFIPPTQEQVSAYMQSRGIPDHDWQAEQFWNHHANRKWRVSGGRGPVMEDWKKAVVTWQGNMPRFGGHNGAGKSGNTESSTRARERRSKEAIANVLGCPGAVPGAAVRSLPGGNN